MPQAELEQGKSRSRVIRLIKAQHVLSTVPSLDMYKITMPGLDASRHPRRESGDDEDMSLVNLVYKRSVLRVSDRRIQADTVQSVVVAVNVCQRWFYGSMAQRWKDAQICNARRRGRPNVGVFHSTDRSQHG